MFAQSAGAIKDRIVEEQAEAMGNVKNASVSGSFKKFDEFVGADVFLSDATEDMMDIIGGKEGAELYKACKAYDVCEDTAGALLKSLEVLLPAADLMMSQIVLDHILVSKQAFDDNEVAMEGLLQPLADMTVVQAGLRELGAHESRAVLARKCRKGLAKRRYMRPNPKLLKWLQTLEES